MFMSCVGNIMTNQSLILKQAQLLSGQGPAMCYASLTVPGGSQENCPILYISERCPVKLGKRHLQKRKKNGETMVKRGWLLGEHGGTTWFEWEKVPYLVAHPTNRKWVITPVISGLTLLIPFITGVITYLLSGMSHQVVSAISVPSHWTCRKESPSLLRPRNPRTILWALHQSSLCPQIGHAFVLAEVLCRILVWVHILMIYSYNML